MGKPGSSVKDLRSLQAELERQSNTLDRAAGEDVVIDDVRRLLLRSPNGTFWAITVDDAGGLATVNMGANPL